MNLSPANDYSDSRAASRKEAMNWSLVVLALALQQDIGGEPPILNVGEMLAGEITDGNPLVHTPELDRGHTDAPTVGQSVLVVVDEPGTYTLELRSYLFDAYLVLYDESDVVQVEDDDGLIGTHARIVVQLEPGIRRIDACALHGQRGAFELSLRRGRPPELSSVERARAQRADLERAIAAVEAARGPGHPDLLVYLNLLALLLQDQGDYSEAQPLFERALAICEQARGPEHPQTATLLGNLARLLQDEGDYAAARLLFERALAIDEKALGLAHPGTATDLNNLAYLLQLQGEYGTARTLYARALEIKESVLGPEHVETARVLNNLGLLLWKQAEYTEARPLLERALGIFQKTFGPEHAETARSLSNLGQLLQDMGDYAAARPLLERGVAIRERTLGPEHPNTAPGLSNLATLLFAQGEWATARPLFERALTIREKVLGADHPVTALALGNLASLLQAQGDLATARPLLERSLAIREKALGPEHPDTAMALSNLASLLEAQGDVRGALSLFERALAINEKVCGPEHPRTGEALNNLAWLLQAQGDFESARQLLQRALNISENALGPDHPETATLLNNLGLLLWQQSDYAAARPVMERALEIRKRALGAEHPFTAQVQHNLGGLLADLDLQEESTDHALAALRARVRHAEETLWSLSERERFELVGRGEEALRGCLLDSERSALPEAYDLALAWRGLVSRTLLASRTQLRASLPAEAIGALQRLGGVQAELSKRLYATEIPDRQRHEREIRALRELRNTLEVEVQRLSGPSLLHAPTLAELEQALAPSEAFIDFLVHPLYVPAEREGEKIVRKGSWSEDHLTAWIVRKEHVLACFDLGPSADIENAARAWLKSVVSDVPPAARGIGVAGQEDAAFEDGSKLVALLWNPLAAELAGVERVFVRPDSFLGTLPFGILLDGGKFLLEEIDFVYVQAPEDILCAARRSSTSSLFAVGGVDFERRGELEPSAISSATVASTSLTDELRGNLNSSWNRLPETEIEVQAVNELFEASFAGSQRLLLYGDQPTEERLKYELPRHAYVHLATHGFFHPAGTASIWDSAREAARKSEVSGLELEARGLVGELPGLLSGLVCAGANGPAPAGRDDGLLTAEEVLWLDLSKVELVVLSACETALGERRSGEGMIGLRRAFGLAGAKTVVSSLWSVKDRSTNVLMQRFYQNLLVKKQGGSEALREAQLSLLAENRAKEHDALPSTWGAFVLSGQWR